MRSALSMALLALLGECECAPAYVPVVCLCLCVGVWGQGAVGGGRCYDVEKGTCSAGPRSSPSPSPSPPPACRVARRCWRNSSGSEGRGAPFGLHLSLCSV